MVVRRTRRQEGRTSENKERLGVQREASGPGLPPGARAGQEWVDRTCPSRVTSLGRSSADGA